MFKKKVKNNPIKYCTEYTNYISMVIKSNTGNMFSSAILEISSVVVKVLILPKKGGGGKHDN